MKVQYSSETPKKSAKRKKSKRRMKPIFYVCVITLTVGVVLALMLTVLFNVNSFIISGSSIYSRDEILSAAGIEKGDNLLRFSTKNASYNIENSLPYIKEAEVIRKFPSTLVINITAAEESLVFKSEDTEYIVDRDFKILDIDPSFETGLTVVRGVDLSGGKEGELMTFDSDEKKKALEILIEMFESRDIKVTYYNVDDPVDLCAVIEDRVYVEFGSVTNLDRKFELMQQAIQNEPQTIQMELSLKNWSVDDPKCVRRYRDVTGIYK